MDRPSGLTDEQVRNWPRTFSDGSPCDLASYAIRRRPTPVITIEPGEPAVVSGADFELERRALAVPAEIVEAAVAAFEEHFWDYAPGAGTAAGIRFALAACERDGLATLTPGVNLQSMQTLGKPDTSD